MSRIKRTFSSLQEQGKQALIAYLVAGVPNVESTVSLMHLMIDKGVDILELGVAFSDPMSEGPLIQKAHEKALTNNVTIKEVLYIVKKFRKKDNHTPVVLMGYTNPFESMGVDKFCSRAAAVGIDGLLLVDMPFEESSEFYKAATSRNIDIIRLVAPTTNKARVKEICLNATGYIYFISLKGIRSAMDEYSYINIDTEKQYRKEHAEFNKNNVNPTKQQSKRNNKISKIKPTKEEIQSHKDLIKGIKNALWCKLDY